jgi:4-amino-4-deoxy-L-arabinose transferase-like glycosyltransferase
MKVDTQRSKRSSTFPSLTASDYLISVLLFGLAMGVYWFTASLTFISGDELFLYDATQAFATRGDVMRSITADLDWPGHSQAEPLFPMLASVLLRLALHIPTIGNTHTTLMFNLLVTSGSVVVLFWLARRLRYNQKVALTAAVLYAFTTIAWPYSKNFFREPLFTLVILLASYCLITWRETLNAKKGLGFWWLILTIGFVIASAFSKETGLLVLPIYGFMLFSNRTVSEKKRRQLIQVVVGMLGVLLLIFLLTTLYASIFGVNARRWEVLERLSQMQDNFAIAWRGILGFWVSPGKSVFLFSPILLLSLTGFWLKRKQNWLEYLWPLLTLVIFTFTYAFVRGDLWFGGTNWGPRYLVPITPWLMIASLPAIELAWQGNNRWRLALLGLALLGFAVQIGAVSVNPLRYYNILDQSGIAGAPWTVGLWQYPWAGIPWHWQLMAEKNWDFVWWQAIENRPLWGLASALVGWTLLSAVLLWYVVQKQPNALQALMFIPLYWIIFFAGNYFVLTAIYPDKNYSGQRAELHQMRQHLQEITQTDSAIFLNNRQYMWFMMNYFKSNTIWYTLASDLSPLPTRVDFLAEPVTFSSTRASDVITYFGREYSNLFFVSERSNFDAITTRGLEWWLFNTYYYGGTLEYAQDLRLIRFSAQIAPTRTTAPDFALDYLFGNLIRLKGFDANPVVGIVKPGEVINVSSVWLTDQPISAPYSIGTFLVNQQGMPIANIDSMPVGNFWATTQWLTGSPVRQNIALVIPENAPNGRYDVWLLIYNSLDGTRLSAQDTTGTLLQDHVLLYSIEISK